MALLVSEFPINVSYGSVSMTKYSTRIITSGSGWENRNINWEEARMKFNAATGIQTQEHLDSLLEFFHAMKGRGLSFRFKDWGDFKSKGVNTTPTFTDQHILTATGGETIVTLRKFYEEGAIYTERTITQPIESSVLVGKNGILQTSGVDYNMVDGQIVFTSALSASDSISAGFEFDVPCRFDTDELITNLDAYHVGNIVVPVIEVRM